MVSSAARKTLQSVVILESLCVPERRSKEVKQVWTEEGGGQVQFFKVITGKTKKTKDTFNHDAVTVLAQSDTGLTLQFTIDLESNQRYIEPEMMLKLAGH